MDSTRPRRSIWDRLANMPELELRSGEELLFRAHAVRRPSRLSPWVSGPHIGFLFCTNQRLLWLRQTRPTLVGQAGDRLEFTREDIDGIDAPSLVGDRGRWWIGQEPVDIYTKRGPKYTFGLSKREGLAYILDQWARKT